jgi:DNA-binding NarL/FixJ family response regulator
MRSAMASFGAKSIRVLLVDDHRVVRAALSLFIQNREGMTMVGEAGNHSEAIAIAGREQPDVILLDLDLGVENGLDLIHDLLAAAGQARIIILTGTRDLEAHHRALSLGAMGVVDKANAPEVLMSAIERVHAGEAWLDPSLTARLLGEISKASRPKKPDPEAAKIATLTDREREVVTMVGEGQKNRQIAQRLFISEWTVRHHITSIFSKLEVSDRVELMMFAYRHGLAKPPG